MLPLTPFNGHNPIVLFCGGQSGQSISADEWGDYGYPRVDTWTKSASNGCHRITPEPTDGSTPAYVQDDNLPVGRSMSQFVALPDGTLLLLNGAQYGTAGYAERTQATLQLPYGMSLATNPVLQPVIYNPNAPSGSRWSSAGLGSSTIPRMYHSTAVLLPDGSVMIAGSNPNADVNTTTTYPTTYTAEYFYPPYFGAQVRPAPQNVPNTLSYGGNPFDITIPPSSYSGSADDAAASTTIWLIRQGFSTHAMGMGQRSMQLNNTYTVQSDGTIIVHTAQLPPNPNLFQPGPGFLFVTISGIPSNGTFVTVGNGQIGAQPTAAASVLPASLRAGESSGSGSNSTGSDKKNGGLSSHGAVGHLLVALVAVAVTLALSS